MFVFTSSLKWLWRKWVLTVIISMDECPSHTGPWPSDANHSVASSSQYTPSATVHHWSLWVKRTYCWHHPRGLWGSCRTRSDQEARLLKRCLIGAEYSPKLLFFEGDQSRSSKDEGASKILFLERNKWDLFEVLILSERSVFSKCIYWNLYPQLIVLGDRDCGRWCVDEDRA